MEIKDEEEEVSSCCMSFRKKGGCMNWYHLALELFGKELY